MCDRQIDRNCTVYLVRGLKKPSGCANCLYVAQSLSVKMKIQISVKCT